ncbi:hypothetical protein ACWOAH_02810 [Vagococcus vulneris]|uniref:Uncharacterized protein n=1 Tax=Vagococcus vulneris TaxID=1977869 RepID=A0A430A0U5_9ENTE|nr:hypothetical protein [Vagococcus vulneris]RSU00018.1 hypothetical protein CBF37_01570 [Vagococcus vulneris]
MRSNEINIETIVKYLEAYSGEKYIDPEKAGPEKAKMEKFRDLGKEARQEFIKLGNLIENSLPDFEAGRCTNWINQGQNGYSYFLD